MTKGTQAQGKRGNKSHTLSRYSGKQNWHKQKKRCASTGHPSGKVRRYHWSLKSKRRTGQGTGRMRTLRHLARKVKKGYAPVYRARMVSLVESEEMQTLRLPKSIV